MFRKKKTGAAAAAQAEAELQALAAQRELPAPMGDRREAGALELAFLGDAVYELMVRAFVYAGSAGNVQTLHRDAVYYSNASFQAAAAARLEPLFTEAEAAVYRRGRNAHAGHTPKNKTEAEYHKATGLEAVFGRLYLDGCEERLQTLFRLALTEKEEEENLN